MRDSEKKLFENFQDKNFNPDERYNLAYKRVKRIKGFYVHAMVYVLVNAFIIISSYNRSLFGNEVFLRWETFSTALFWGIGLLAHGLSVFGSNLFFGQNWEERKIQEFMEKDKSEKWE
ncbi:2TM domain-containing protein [Flavobacterium franklandianum]|uniref:2TM domain-containing protein n=1 Tax=Flavobacterium franklandianum TaxID=2594430 RepID=A0A553C7I2_9FLAO|nr:2TM domain-containing protein [Flavobacterium franklandianum]TRX16413.1 2TM domain-containing protein [Flavobacterium franklandianum]